MLRFWAQSFHKSASNCPPFKNFFQLFLAVIEFYISFYLKKFQAPSKPKQSDEGQATTTAPAKETVQPSSVTTPEIVQEPAEYESIPLAQPQMTVRPLCLSVTGIFNIILAFGQQINTKLMPGAFAHVLTALMQRLISSNQFLSKMATIVTLYKTV